MDSTITTTTAITATTAPAEESGQEKTSNPGGIASGAVGGAVFLAGNQRRGVPQQAYGEATIHNPTFDDSPAPASAEVDAESAYVPAVPGRAIVYDQGRLAGARNHALRDKWLSQQLANSHA
eukprot:gene3089-32154_t